MPNNFDSNITRKLARSFLDKFESMRVLSKNVNTQFVSGAFNASTGDTIDIKRPTDYTSVRTPTGDISAETADPIITGKASAIVQDYFTTYVDYDEADEAIKMDQLDELLAPQAQRIVTDMELDFARFAMKNCNLTAGTIGTPVTTWDHIAESGAVLEASGVPKDGDWCYFVNPFTQRRLASNQRSLGAGGSAGELIRSSNEKATIAEDFAGMMVKTATTLGSYTSGAGADRAGTIASNPDVTYVAAKDSMQQTIAVAGFQANLEIKAGEQIRITGRNRLNLATRELMIDETGSSVEFTATVAADVTLSGTGTGNIVISGPAIFEAGGAYNTVDSAPVSGDVITLLGAASTAYQPNLFWHKQAFCIGSVPIKKLHSTDTLAKTKDGLQMRVSKGVDFLANKQIVRFDFRPAYGVFNPFFAGQSFGFV